jgi:hypothetical protein
LIFVISTAITSIINDGDNSDRQDHINVAKKVKLPSERMMQLHLNSNMRCDWFKSSSVRSRTSSTTSITATDRQIHSVKESWLTFATNADYLTTIEICMVKNKNENKQNGIM